MIETDAMLSGLRSRREKALPGSVPSYLNMGSDPVGFRVRSGAKKRAERHAFRRLRIPRATLCRVNSSERASERANEREIHAPMNVGAHGFFHKTSPSPSSRRGCCSTAGMYRDQ